jgi:hypothetical protein
MSSYRNIAVLAAIFILTQCGVNNLIGQESAATASVLHLQQSQTTSQTGFPSYLNMYKVLDGATSSAQALSLTGTISLRNYDPTFSEVLWILAYWQGECPTYDITLSKVAGFLWSDILKNPSQSDSTFTVNLAFPNPLPATGCIGLFYSGGPLVQGKLLCRPI